MLILFVRSNMHLRITCRLALLTMIAICRYCHTLIEQPRTSLMKHFDPFVALGSSLAHHFGILWLSTNMLGPHF